ncbi:MAG: hypothetical protein MUP71_14210 [Candidatus Aminicenantes bacterium]|nr:hypothetical protein [Candidatus Aminicenantes bacterium]
MKKRTTMLVLLVLWTAAFGLNAQEKQPQQAAQFEITPAIGKIKIDGNQDVDLTRSDRTFFLKIG